MMKFFQFFVYVSLPFLLGVAVLYVVVMRLDDTAPSTLSYQAQNLEVLKTARHDDLVICVAKKVGEREEIRFAFLVDQSNGDTMTGNNVNGRSLSRQEGGWNIPLMSPWKCEMRIVRGGPARDQVSSIIFDGLNPPPPK